MNGQSDHSGESVHRATHRNPHHPIDDGCKSRSERAAPPTGPGRGLTPGYSDDAGLMRGEGKGLGPPLDLKPHGPPSRGVNAPSHVEEGQCANRDSSPLVVLDDDESTTEAAKSSPDRVGSQIGITPAMVCTAMTLGRIQAGWEASRASVKETIRSSGPKSALYFADRLSCYHARTWDIREDSKPLSRPVRRGARVEVLPSLESTGTGLGHRRHVPLTTRIRVNDSESTPLPALLDTGASLSSIDASLLDKLGGKAHGQPIAVHGIGDTRTLGYATVTFFIDAHDARGMPVQLEARHDFHVLPSLGPGILLGLDFIVGHELSIEPSSGRAVVGPYRFSVQESMMGPFAKEAELCLVRDIVVPARSHSWVPVDVGALAPDVDYTAHPRLMVNAAETIRLAGPMGMITKATAHVLLTNVGEHDVHLERRTPVADAVAAHLGDTIAETGETFVLTAADHSPSAPAFTQSAVETSDDGPDAAPIDAFEGEHGFGGHLAKDAATVEVDGHWRVGVDGDGNPDPRIVELLHKHRDAFALDGRPGRIVGHELEIQLREDAVLRPEAPRRMSPEKLRACDAALDQLLDWDVVEPSASPLSFPVLMVKQQTKWRFCVDYRQLNTATIPDRYPLPHIDAVFDTLTGKTVFSSLDALRGYHQLPVKVEDRWKTAFVCHRGLYQYKTVPFGLRNAPAVFQRLMDRLLAALRWRHAVVYIDDIVVASRTMEEHLWVLDQLLSRAREFGLKFGPAKCTFAVPSLVLLGRKVSGAGLAVWKDRASAVTSLQPPTTLRDLYHVLGLFGYYRPFIPHFARLASPLTALTRGWRYEHVDGRYRLTDDHGKAVSADRVPIDWTAERQQSFEALKAAIANPPVLAHPDPSRPYLLYVDASKEAFAAVLHQWHADERADSAPPPPDSARLFALSTLQLPTALARERWLAWLREDRIFSSIMRDLEAGRESPWSLSDGLLIRRVDGKVALPEGGVPELLRSIHDGGGHFGFTKTWMAVSRHFWRPGLATAVRAWVRPCSVCQAVKVPRRVGSLRVDDDPQDAFEKISLDLLLALFKDITAAGVAAVISDRVLRLGWRPRRIVSDSEAKMTGLDMQALATSLGAVLTPSPPHHQQANPVERAIQKIQVTLRTMCLESTRAWDRRVVPAVELALNSSPNVSTGYRPFDLVFISHPDVVHALFDAPEHDGVGSLEERLAAAAERLAEAKETLDAARLVQKRRYDQRRRPLPVLEVGDLVWIRLADRPVPGVLSSKLVSRKLGPYPVAEVLSSHRVRLALPSPLRIQAEFSVEQLDVMPKDADPFEGRRAPPVTLRAPEVDVAGRDSPDEDLHEDVNGSAAGAHDESVPAGPGETHGPVRRPRRALQLPSSLREYETQQFASSSDPVDVFATPSSIPRLVQVDGRTVSMVERPVAFLSRLTTPTEKKMAAAELELCCLAWAFGRLAHLLEGVPVTVVTDHAALGRMLQSTGPIPYGPTISKCRAILMPHMENLRFIHKPGRKHTNADALSRLVVRSDPSRSAFEGGDVLDGVD
ncbi:hypothetical protein A4X13_0g7639 [Tilletia indica]|uniref:RNA-directed DNA polymerase n=1 Tax=Tilletia indica TaxID=43049 RepID=A0A177T425_9BASI|nr:hypothetical protein A4X13_0g7639 [Tilletia indica]